MQCAWTSHLRRQRWPCRSCDPVSYPLARNWPRLLGRMAGCAVEVRAGDFGLAFELGVVRGGRRRRQALGALLPDVARLVVTFETAILLLCHEVAVDRMRNARRRRALPKRGRRYGERNY